MLRKYFYKTIAVFALSLVGGIAVFAQTYPITGMVEVKKSDDTTTPVEGALVEIFRVDQKGASLKDKTNKRGEFSFAGVVAGGTYILSVSGPGISPALSQNLKAGASDVKIVVSAGDGKRLTEEEVRAMLAGAPSTPTEVAEFTEESKKAEEERLKMIAEYEANKKKIESRNEQRNQLLAEGLKAFEAKNYDVAIVKFGEGYELSPDFVGSAPIMANNKALSLVKRALLNYNTMVQSKDAALKKELRPKVNADFEAALDTYYKAWMASKNGDPAEIAKIQVDFDKKKMDTLIGANEAVNLMVRTEGVSEAKKDIAMELVKEYVAAEKDQAKRADAQLYLGLYLNKVYDFENAVAEFRKAVQFDPKSADAVGQLGLALYTASYGSEDTAKKQEALNYLQMYLDMAPKDHSLRDGIDGAVVDLKNQKLKPQKIASN
ncbi:MAG: hypothetical protein KIS76_11375 [Pyrinomonadaceae bacterium]|nr:hypothetical protein [Pyrinomonadaceae bacterium]